MILIYTDNSTTRLQYTCKFIFNELLGITHSLTTDRHGFELHEGPKISYSREHFNGAFHICPHTLLFETGISKQEVTCFDSAGRKAFFKTNGTDFDFDIFAAIFYLISRYEEYLPHELDMYGRYAHENSIAYKEGFLNQPLVNNWVITLGEKLCRKFPSLKPDLPVFSFLPTYDIDIAYSFRYKGFVRNLGGFIKSPSWERIAVLSGMKKDPFDSYDYMDKLHETYKLNPIYFFLVATSGSIYDKNISPYSGAMWQLLKRHSKKYRAGLHPSWRSNRDMVILEKEKKVLETVTGLQVKLSRQHYIKFSMPETFERLIKAGIEIDFSMGYGSINGFRASVASSFFWYNLKTETITKLRLYPYCFMDANSFYEQKYNAEEAYRELSEYAEKCRQVNGTLITLFHNNFLGNDKQFNGWKEMYERFISQLPPAALHSS